MILLCLFSVITLVITLVIMFCDLICPIRLKFLKSKDCLFFFFWLSSAILYTKLANNVHPVSVWELSFDISG